MNETTDRALEREINRQVAKRVKSLTPSEARALANNRAARQALTDATRRQVLKNINQTTKG